MMTVIVIGSFFNVQTDAHLKLQPVVNQLFNQPCNFNL